jgi:hypothetical protein
MQSTTRATSLVAGLLLAVAPAADAQALATFGSAELAGYGEGSALIGASLSTGRQGLGPVATLVAQTYRFRSGVNAHTQAYAVSPSLGLQYTMPTGAVQGSVGYTFVNTEFLNVIAGSEVGGRSGVFVSGQGNYWGTGENTAQVIGSYNFESEYYWTRGRAAHRLAPSANPIYVGGEVVVQGSQNFTPSLTRYQVGPTIEYRISPDLRVGASAGYRGGNNNFPGSGYARVEFLALSRF